MAELYRQQLKIEYQRPKLHRRIFAALIDLILLAIAFVGIFMVTREIVYTVPDYKTISQQVEKDKVKSGLYIKTAKGDIVDIVSYCSNMKEFNDNTKRYRAQKAIRDFFEFIEPKVSDELYSAMLKDYDDFRLNKNLVYDNEPYFIYSEEKGKVIENPDCKASFIMYFNDAYAQYIDLNCQNYFIKYTPNYYENMKYISNVVLFAEIPVSILVSSLIVYLIPPLIMWRGRTTLGKMIYKIGAVNSKDYFNVSVGKCIARFCVFFFGIVLLSFVTLGIPMIINFTMMAFSKKGQTFVDYMLGIEEIDMDSGKIYRSREEAILDYLDNSKVAVDFKMEETI